jgi:hypothetical protein
VRSRGLFRALYTSQNDSGSVYTKVESQSRNSSGGILTKLRKKPTMKRICSILTEEDMPIESILSKVAYDTLVEQDGYKGNKALFIIGAVLMIIDTTDGILKINGLKSGVESLPKRVDKVILQN